jgi:hypothetical protein
MGFNTTGNAPDPYEELGNGLRWVLTVMIFVIMGVFVLLSLAGGGQ